jgi:putative transposase
METFRQMVNDCIRIGLENNISTMKRQQLANYDVISYYRLCIIWHAAGILINRKKSVQCGKFQGTLMPEDHS